ncbi:MAG: hypothetical protein AAGG51_10315 [Cyanobacteria bacterium P01_G01_bin.54]
MTESARPTPWQFLTPLTRGLWAADGNPTVLGHLLVAGCFIGSVAIADFGLSQLAIQKKHRWMALYYPPEVATIGSPQAANLQTVLEHNQKRIDTLLQDFDAEPQLKQRLRSQFLRLQTRALIHSDVAAFFYGRSFVTLSIVSVSGIIALLCLFFISKDGWDDSSTLLLNLFVLAAGTVVLYGNLSIFLQYEANSQENIQVYTACINLREEFLSYLVTQQSRSGNTLTPTEFIHYIDLQFELLNGITLNFDNQKLLDYTNQFETLLQNGADESIEAAP